MKIIVALVVCLFMGITVISVGLGAAFPSINRIAKPIVCSDGEMTQESRIYNPYPGKTVTSQTWYCASADGTSKRQLSMFPISFIAGSVYGLILFALMFVRRLFRG
ncbi:MAG: hypothetical protein K8S54_08585 [Spirochaetia bacterium]|nr:hypothetical protein [Spirochaetia bacterium]